MLLNSGESVIRQEAVRKISGNAADGTLILTNQRLVFEVPKKGSLFHGRSTSTVIDSQLAFVSNAEVAKPLVGRPTLVVHVQTGRAEFKTSDAASWRDAIAAAKASAPPPGGFAPWHAPPVVVNVGSTGAAPPATQPSPPAPTKPSIHVRCSYCKNVYDEVASGGRCPKCGASF